MTALFSVVIQAIAIFVLFVLLIYTSLQKPTDMQKNVLVLIIAAIFFLAGYIIRLYSQNFETALLGAVITYIGQPFVLLYSMMLIASFYGFVVNNWIFISLSAYSACVPVIIYTNSFHHLFYATAVYNDAAKFSPLSTTHGPLYNVNLIYALAIFIADCVMIVKGYKKSTSKAKKSLSIYCFLMVGTGMIGYALYFAKVTGGYDTTMMGVSIGVIFLCIMFFRCKIFDYIDKAKDFALDNSSDALIIYDDNNTIVYNNEQGKSLLTVSADEVKPYELPEGNYIRDFGDKHYNTKVMVLTKGSTVLGKSVKFSDVTESVDYEHQLEKAIRETTERLESVQRTLFASLANVVEARSLETGDHIKRVSAYTEMIAKSLKNKGMYPDIINDEYINMLVVSAPLHDIGKISISDTILLKPGKLTDEEFEIMKTHSEKGYKIIENVMQGLEDDNYIEMASEIAHYHHEKWDGNGYPDHLKGEEIPLSARIVALADCYDAMTSQRCYKDAFPDEKALGIIIEEKGTHFDPDVVDAFLACRRSN